MKTLNPLKDKESGKLPAAIETRIPQKKSHLGMSEVPEVRFLTDLSVLYIKSLTSTHVGGAGMLGERPRGSIKVSNKTIH